jgi:TATA-binding protein-associated factor Taf7
MPGRTKKQEQPVTEDATMEDAPPSAQDEAGEAEDEQLEQDDEPEEVPQRVRIVRDPVFGFECSRTPTDSR